MQYFGFIVCNLKQQMQHLGEILQLMRRLIRSTKTLKDPDEDKLIYFVEKGNVQLTVLC